ncbi:MAG: hypothetical protein ACRDYX_18320 [Egibacteraceae bacterium]
MEASKIRELAQAVQGVPLLTEAGMAWQLVGHLHSTLVELLEAVAAEVEAGRDTIPVDTLLTRMHEYAERIRAVT